MLFELVFLAASISIFNSYPTDIFLSRRMSNQAKKMTVIAKAGGGGGNAVLRKQATAN